MRKIEVIKYTNPTDYAIRQEGGSVIASRLFDDKTAERLASCWNACLNLENPEQDFKKIVEALKEYTKLSYTKEKDCAVISLKSLSKVTQLISEALALIKE
jgi:hypothetical protein